LVDVEEEIGEHTYKFVVAGNWIVELGNMSVDSTGNSVLKKRSVCRTDGEAGTLPLAIVRNRCRVPAQVTLSINIDPEAAARAAAQSESQQRSKIAGVGSWPTVAC